MIELFLKGGALMWPLLALSIIALAVILEREYFFFSNRVSETQLTAIKSLLLSGRVGEAESAVSGSKRILLKFLSAVFSNRDNSVETAEREISFTGEKLLFQASRFIHVLELIGSISPMIGLSGTVVGMVRTFQQVGINTGTQIDPSLLADGIWVAMLTTVAGLFVAIPSFIFAHINNRRLRTLKFNMKIYGEEFNSILHSIEKRPAADD